MLQILSCRKSSRSLQIGSESLFSGTTHCSPSGGKKSQMAFPKGLYGTSNSSSKAFLLSLLAFDFSESSDEVAFGIARRYIPFVYRDKNLLTKKRWCLASTHSNAWKET